MDFDDFQDKAMHFAKYPKATALMYTTLGLCGEVGEVANKVKKVYRDNAGVLTEEARLAIGDELSDTLWYLAATAFELNITLNETALGCLIKLQDRLKRNVIQGSGDKR